MFVRPTAINIERDGVRHAGVYSVSGHTLIARIPGVSSRSTQIEDGADPQTVARALLTDMLDAMAADHPA